MRIRISYKKLLPIRFTSALDMQRIWERSIRRSGIKISYSQGFHPQPKIQLGLPLPLGYISEDEKVDIWLENEIDLDFLLTELKEKLPVGIDINAIDSVDTGNKPLVTSITTAEYAVRFWDKTITTNSLKQNISTLLQENRIIRKKRNNKTYDLRPLILDLSTKEQKDMFNLYIKLRSEQNHMGRADEVMFALGFKLNEFLIKRIKFY